MSAGDYVEHFQLAVSFLSGQTDLAKAAYDWMVGGSLSSADLKKLGISQPITAPETGRAAIRLFAALFRRAGRPLILYIDQYENLVCGDNLLQSRQNIGWLRSLVEDVPSENGLLVLSGNNEAWDVLTPDIKTRVPDENLITLPAWTLRQTRQLIKLYVTPTTLPYDASSDVKDQDLYPFTADGVKKILEFGSGNTRRILQIAASALEKAIPKEATIDPDFIITSVKQGERIYFDKETVTAQIQKILLERSLSVRIGFDYEDIVVDFAVLSEDGAPRLLIELSKALFSGDEAAEVLSHIQLIEKLGNNKSSPHFLLIVLGYMSPDVTRSLEPFVHEMIVYRPETFASEFIEALHRMPPAWPARGVSPEAATLREELGAFRKELERLLEKRGFEEQVLRERVVALADQQSKEQADARKAVGANWATAGERIEARISVATDKRAPPDVRQQSRPPSQPD
jgi:hypothetical protein